MKKLFITTLSVSLAGFYLASFFIPRTVAIEYSNAQVKTPFYLKMISDVKDEFIAGGKNFLEVNLSAMLIRLYRDGKSVKEWPILKKGNPQEWGGSPLGLYKILSAQKLGFSTIADAFMPYALNYYGKYYIHGEPYYANGKLWLAAATGGCIQLHDKDAKDVYGLVNADTPILVLDRERDYYVFSRKNLSDFPEISAKSYLVADLDSGFVFAEKDSQEQLPIASLAQLMTAVVVAENVDLRKDILVESGERLSVIELFYALLMESSSDAAEVLSRFLGKAKTVAMMNEKARAILMEKTEFADPRGSDYRNVSNVIDLFRLAGYITSSRPLLLEITKGKEVKNFGGFSFNAKETSDKNIFADNPNFLGGNAGCTAQFNCNALFVFRFPTGDERARDTVIILLGSKDEKIDSQKIYQWLLGGYFTDGPL